MEYAALVEVYRDLESTRSTLRKRDLLVVLFEDVDAELLPAIVRLVRGRVFAPSESRDLGVASSLALEAVVTATGVDADRIETWWREEGDLGSAASKALAHRRQRALVSDPLEVSRVYDTLRRMATFRGEGSQSRLVETLAGLISDADPEEATYLVRTVLGALRIGVGDGLVRDVIAHAFLDGDDDVDAVERAYAVTNDFALVADRARVVGRAGLTALDLEVFRPVKPMLATRADRLAAAFADLADESGEVLLEAKYDGIRAKLHGSDGEIRVFTRRLEEITTQFPDVVEAIARCVTADEFIVEAEIVGVDPDTERPVPFQELSRRIQRKHDVDRLAEAVPVAVQCFDLLLVDGATLLEWPLRERLGELEGVLAVTDRRIGRATNVRTDSLPRAQEFYQRVLDAGHEGVMLKNLDAGYRPGARVGYQAKLKATMEPLDLVVTRAIYSEGRKRGYLGRPYLAARGPDGTFQEVGRMHTGFTDEQLEEFTSLLEPHIEEVDGREARVRPTVVLEVEFDEIQRSSTYASGFALRFPRLRRIRYDLGPEDAEPVERVRELFER